MPQLQFWDVILPDIGPVRVEYDGGDTMVVNKVNFKVGTNEALGTHFCHYGNYKVEVSRRSKRASGGFRLKVDGKMVEEGGVSFRKMEEGVYAISGEAASEERRGGGGGGISDLRWTGVAGGSGFGDGCGDGFGDGESGMGEEHDDDEEEVVVEEEKYNHSCSEWGEEERRDVGSIASGSHYAPSSLPRGVQYDEVSKEFTAGMSIKGKYRILGRFKDVKEAKECYEEAYVSNRRRK